MINVFSRETHKKFLFQDDPINPPVEKDFTALKSMEAPHSAM